MWCRRCASQKRTEPLRCLAFHECTSSVAISRHKEMASPPNGSARENWNSSWPAGIRTSFVCRASRTASREHSLRDQRLKVASTTAAEPETCVWLLRLDRPKRRKVGLDASVWRPSDRPESRKLGLDGSVWWAFGSTDATSILTGSGSLTISAMFRLIRVGSRIRVLHCT